MYRIRCYVSGGITGDREAWLKASDGSIYETEYLFEGRFLGDIIKDRPVLAL